MRLSRFWLVLLALSLILVLGSAPSPAAADGLSIFPPSGLPGATFQIQGVGFAANETVVFWAQYPDGRAVQLGSAQADGSGSATFQLHTDASYPLGSYLIVAHGQSSGKDVWGKLTLGSGAAGPAVSGTAYCSSNNFVIPGFAPGEPVAILVQVPDGSIIPLTAVTADGGGNASFPLNLQPGMSPGTYTIMAQGLLSGHQTSDALAFDGRTVTGSNCSISLGGGPFGYVPGVIPNNIVNYSGPGVYLGTDPSALYYFDCNWKWRPMGGIVYMLVLGFKPFETVNVSYEILAVQGRTPYGTIYADSYGNAAFAVNTMTMPKGHYHWWFTSASASYCGHYDPAYP